MTGEMRRQLAAIACEKIENAGRKVTRRDDFGKGKRRERIRRRSERDDAVAAGDDRGNDRHQSRARPGASGASATTTPVGSGMVKLKCERRDRIYRSENLRKLVRPTGVINQAINRGRYFAARPGPGSGQRGQARFPIPGAALPAFRPRDTKFGPANKRCISSSPGLRFVPPGPHRENLFAMRDNN